MQVQNTKPQTTSPINAQASAQGSGQTQSTLAKAKRGDLDALEKLMGSPLRAKDIRVRVKRKGQSLAVSMIGKQAPSQKVCLSYVKRGLTKLGLEGIETVHVTGFQTGKFNPLWSDDIHLGAAPVRNITRDSVSKRRAQRTQAAQSMNPAASNQQGLHQNGLHQNGLHQNGHRQNGLRQLAAPAKQQGGGGKMLWAIAGVLLTLLALGLLAQFFLNSGLQGQEAPASVQDGQTSQETGTIQ